MGTALIIGGKTGIGRAVADRLEEILEVVTTDASDLDCTKLRDSSYEGMFHRFLGSVAPQRVVYCAGINRLDWIGDVEQQDFSDTMAVNVYGFISLLKGIPLDHPASIVAVTSDAAWRPMRTSISYCASKAALEMAVKVASRERAAHGWRINAVAPGKVFDTPMTEYVDKRVMELRGWTKEYAEAYEMASSPVGCLSKDEVAKVIVQVLLSDSPGFTGAVIPVNGGR